MAQSSEDLLRECQDSFDVVTQSDLATLEPSELVLLELPPPWESGRRYRCLAKESLRRFASASAKRLPLVEEGLATGRVLMPTYLPGVDLEERDFDFLTRMLEQPSTASIPTVLHVERIVEAPAQRVLADKHETSVHVYELAEARWERELWQLFDSAMMPAEATCPEGHQLVLDLGRDLANQGSEAVVCDQCERILVLMDCYTCGLCDFDLCSECFRSRGSDAAKAAGPVAWLQDELAAFWDVHCDFLLPPEPPRQDARDKLPSVAVTKWNEFALSGDLKLQLREVFLRSLQAHGADVDCLRHTFWPGCAEEFAEAKGYIEEARHTMTVSEWRRNRVICAGAAVTLGEGQLQLLHRCVSGRQWELEDGQTVCLEAGSPRGPCSRGGGGAGSPAWLAKGQDTVLLHASGLCEKLGAGWQEARAADLLLAAAAALEEAAERRRQAAARLHQQRQQQQRAAPAPGVGGGRAPQRPQGQPAN